MYVHEMKNLKSIFSALSLVFSASMAHADDVNAVGPFSGESQNSRGAEIFDPNAKPHLDSDNNSFIDALLSLDKVCEASVQPHMIELCSDVGVVVNRENECFDIYDEDLPLVMNGCEAKVALDMALEIQNVFNRHLLDDGVGECKNNRNQQHFTVENSGKKTVFAFPCQQA